MTHGLLAISAATMSIRIADEVQQYMEGINRGCHRRRRRGLVVPDETAVYQVGKWRVMSQNTQTF